MVLRAFALTISATCSRVAVILFPWNETEPRRLAEPVRRGFDVCHLRPPVKPTCAVPDLPPQEHTRTRQNPEIIA